MHRDIHAPRRYLVKLGFPDVRPIPLDQRDVERSSAPIFVTETGRKLQTSGTTADDHDPRFGRLRFAHEKYLVENEFALRI